jgi:hypothetical protein
MVCPRQWALRYWWYFRPIDDNKWRLGGTLLHTCYQYWYASLLPPEARPEWFWEKTLAQRLNEQGVKHPDLVQMAHANLKDYMIDFEDEGHTLTPVGIEEEYQTTLGELDPGGPWPELDNEIVSCRLDLLFRNAAGLWIRDYKSHGRSKVNPRTGRLTRWKEDGEFAIHWQALMNLHILRKCYGPEVLGFQILRATRQPTKYGRYDFDVHVLTITDMAYNETPRMIRKAVRREHEIIEALDRGEPPDPAYHACMGRFGPCDYRDACMAKNKYKMKETLMNPRLFTRPPQEEIDQMRAGLRREP